MTGIIKRRPSVKSGKKNSRPFNWTTTDAAVADALIELEKAGELDKLFPTFDKYQHIVTSQAYWFLLGLIWSRNPDCGNETLPFWLKHFQADKPHREHLMQPHEHQEFSKLPNEILLSRPSIQEYTLALTVSVKNLDYTKAVARHHGIKNVSLYIVEKKHIAAYFRRSRNAEAVVLDPNFLEYSGEIPSE